ncbi:MAG: BatA domain-containing protein, partial [Gemmataceae bacterium]|nr:BatA domain-containing protein [Gemmataceae bacterium]
MGSLFLHPVTMAVGAALISAPIIIHLINRMRFRRIRWAAMEFLLKAQKRMRRKLIIEQLILLFLRCLLVFLAGLLFARFLGWEPFQGKETRPTLHVVVLDDTPSMGDTGGDAQRSQDAYAEARSQLTEKILPATLEAATPQSLRLFRLSDLTDLLASESTSEARRITPELIETVRALLAQHPKVSTVRTSLVQGLEKIKEVCDQAGASSDVAKVAHVLTDLRAIDWSQEGEALTQKIRELQEAGVQVHLIDTASPPRPADRSRHLNYSDNVGIVEFRPRARLAARNDPVDFEVRVKNFGSTDLRDVQIYFFLDGVGHIIPELPFDHLPAGQERTQLIQVQFPEAGSKDNPLSRFHIVTAVLANVPNDALAADNVRHAVIEVRDKLAVLAIVGPDEDLANPDKKSNDSFYLRRLFQEAFKSVDWVTATPDALDKQDLRPFSTIFLLNVPQLTENQVRKLETYIQEGGGVGVFLGPRVNREAYTRLMFRDGQGFFPFELRNDPTPPPTEEQRLLRSLSLSKRILVREAAARQHPAIAGLYTNERGDPDKAQDIERFFYFVNVDQHWPVSRLSWKSRDDQSVQELFCLPNDRPIAYYEPRVMELRRRLLDKSSEPKFEPYRPLLEEHWQGIRNLFAETAMPLTELARRLDRLLADEISEGDPREAKLREFWAQPELAELRREAQALRDDCKYGDPLYIARRFGLGRVTVLTTTAGEPWTDWPSGAGAAGWVAVMKEMQKYLTGGGLDHNRSVGEPFTLTLEPGRYKPTATRLFLTSDTSRNDRGKAEIIREELGEVPL